MLELYRDIYSGRLDNLQMFLLKEFFEIWRKPSTVAAGWRGHVPDRC